MSRAREIAIAAVAYLLLAVAQTWPLCLHLMDRIPHDLGDPLLATYLLNWNAQIVPLTEQWWHPPFFWPTSHTLTLSEPFLGLAPAAWLLKTVGFNAVGVYNVLFVASFWLAALVTYVFVRELTGNSTAAFVAGLAYGFAPYRASQLPHLHLLMTPGLPLMFLGLHRAMSARSIGWAAFAAVCWIWQGMVALYLLAFIPLAVVLWMAWFGRRDARLWLTVGAAFTVAALLIAPVVDRYRQSHRAENYSRELNEVAVYSADVTTLRQASSSLALRIAQPEVSRPEQDLFPGFAVIALAVLAFTFRVPRQSLRPNTAVLLATALMAVLLSVVAALYPVRVQIAGVLISHTTPHKSLAVAWLALCAALLSTRTIADAWSSRSMAAGYALLAVALWTFALGPFPTFAGHEIWYRAPYWFLYHYVPGFDGIRAPARVWILVTLCLAVLAGLGANRVAARKHGTLLVGALCAWLTAEGWIGDLELKTLPPKYAIPAGAEVVVEIPVGDTYDEVAAMYRSMFHGRPILNGYSGYGPRSFHEFVQRIAAGDLSGVFEKANGRSVAVVLHRDSAATSMLHTRLIERGASCHDEGAVVTCLTR